MKNYQYKHYNKNFEFVKVINPNLIKSEVFFTEAINWPQGQLSIRLKIKWEELDYEEWDYIVLRATNQFFPNGYVIYTGYIEEIRKNATEFEEIELVCVWVGSLLTKVIYKDWSDFEFTKNTTPHSILESILDYFDTIYPWIINKGVIVEINENINIEFDYDNCFEAIKKIEEIYNETHFWYIDRTWTFNFKTKEETITHRVNFQKDLQELNQYKELNIVNKLHLIYDWWVGVYEDTDSINKYGLYERVIRDNSIKNTATADEFGNNYIALNKEPRVETDLSINNEFTRFDLAIWRDNLVWNDNDFWFELWEVNWFEWIEIGDKIRVQNIKEAITWPVVRKQYTRDVLMVQLWTFDNFIDLIKQ